MDLSEVKVGDEVYSILRGWGEVTYTENEFVRVLFENGMHTDYCLDGKYFKFDINPEITDWKKKRREWQPKSHPDSYGIWSNGDIRYIWHNNDVVKEGRVYATKKQAKYAYKSIRACQILNAYKAEFAPGWRPDWNDPEQRKWYVYYNIELEKWGMGYCFKQQSPELVCFPTSIVKQLCKDLNDGVVKL